MTMRSEETPAAAPGRPPGELPVRLGISACLLGREVRYDGGHKRDAFLARVLTPHVEWVPVCPEVEIGLGTPRPPIRLEARGGETRLVVPETGEDLTARMRAYAGNRVGQLRDARIAGYVLKARSPSCGLGSVEVRGEDGERRVGDGAFARVLTSRRPHLPVAEETDLASPRRRENFVARVWARHRWLRLLREEADGREEALGREALSRFHARHHCLLLARDPVATRRLDRHLERTPPEPVRSYARGFAETLRRVPTRESHEQVLRDLHGRLADHVPPAARDELADSIDRFVAGREALAGPVERMRELARRHGPAGVREQTYLRPYPDELGLLREV